MREQKHTSQSIHLSQLDLSPRLHHVKRQRQDCSDLNNNADMNEHIVDTTQTGADKLSNPEILFV